jgi:hypothetical protein
MRMKPHIRRLLIVPLLLGVAAIAVAQIPAATAIQTAKACPTINWNQLENNSAVVDAASSLATQMVRRYNDQSKSQPDLGNEWGTFHIKLFAATGPACIQKTAISTVSAPLTANQATNQGTAKATTGQTNKQVGAPSSSDGSTSAVQKVGISQLLGIAVEDGAVTSNVSGATMTLSTTPYGFFTAIGRAPDTQSDYKKFNFFTQVGITATFNVANSSDDLASATRKQVSQWQTKVTFRDTSTRANAVNTLYALELQPAATQMEADLSSPEFGKLAEQLNPIGNAAYLKAWKDSLQPLLSKGPAAGDTNGSQEIAAAAMLILKILDQDPDYQTALSNALKEIPGEGSAFEDLQTRYANDQQAYLEKEQTFFTDVKNLTKGWNGDLAFGQKYPTTATTATAANGSGSSATTTPPIPAYVFAELDMTCDPTKPGGIGPGGGGRKPVHCFLFSNGSWTANFSGTFYTNPRPVLNETTFRGGTGALQAQWELGSGPVKIKSGNDDSQMTLSVSGNYQRLQENKDQKGKRPDIVLGNLKFEIPISSGVSFPLSLTVANATEQIKETYVKGNFGISFDLDKLASLLKAKQSAQ